MAQPNHTPRLAETEETVIVLFCLVEDAYRILNPKGDLYEALKRLSDSEVVTLALLQQLRGTESQRSLLRDAERFYSHLFPGVVGLAPSSLHRRVRKLRRLLEPLRREAAGWSANPRHCSSTRRCFRCCTPGRSTRARALRGRRGRGGAPFRSTG